ASRSVTAPVFWSSRSARVLLPWSMCAMMQKLRIFIGLGGAGGIEDSSTPRAPSPYRLRSRRLQAAPPPPTAPRTPHDSPHPSPPADRGPPQGLRHERLIAEGRHPFQAFLRDGQCPMCWVRRRGRLSRDS